MENNPDPWKHRAKGMKCKTCMWFAAKGATDSNIGRCRRRSPTMSGYPVVFLDDWCGDHKLTEDTDALEVCGSCA